MSSSLLIKSKQIFLCLFAIGSLVNAQERKIKKAQDIFDSHAFSIAIKSYENLVNIGYSSEQVYKNLGNANFQNAKYKEAAKWYSRLFHIGDIYIDSEYMYLYALSLKSTGDYELSNFWMERFCKAEPLDIRSIKFKNDDDYLGQIKKYSGRYIIKNLSYNSSQSDFAPSIYNGSLVFSSARDTGITRSLITEWTKKPLLNLYKYVDGKSSNPTKFSKSISTRTHQSSAVFTKDGKTMYFTRNNSEKGNVIHDDTGYSRLKLYKATKKNGKWSEVTELPFNSDYYSVAHPALSPDEKRLYFASNMPKTIGKSDIFYVDIKENNKYGIPINLGDKINTESRETFPYISSNNILYFASDGHPGLGGLDIFGAKINDEYIHVVNVGQPINSNNDDFSFIIDEQTKKGFFASNRSGGKGDDDIYEFEEKDPINLDCTYLINGKVKEKGTETPLSNAAICFTDNESKITIETFTDVNGLFSIQMNCSETNFKIHTEKEGYETENQNISQSTIKESLSVIIELPKKIIQAPIGENLIKYLNLKPIYFDSNKANIRPDAEVTMNKLVEYLKSNPKMKIDIQSHTDAIGSSQYNENLSEKRVEWTIKYLVTKGINLPRLSGRGYGETKLINNCTTKKSCSAIDHQANRRTEFIVIRD